MLTVNIIALGKLKEDYLRSAAAEYAKRLGAHCNLVINELVPVKLPENPSDSQILSALEKEAQTIRQKQKSGYTVAMCIEGVQLSSTELSEKLSDIALSGKSCVNIIIGSSYGIDERLKKECDLRLSMSKMTFPHQLARVMLLEQLYRAFMISANTRYHK